MKQIQLIDGKVCVDHIHMYVGIPPKISVSEFMSYLKGKSTLMLFDRHPEYRTKWGDRHFWARGCYVSTVGNVNEETKLDKSFILQIKPRMLRKEKYMNLLKHGDTIGIISPS